MTNPTNDQETNRIDQIVGSYADIAGDAKVAYERVSPLVEKWELNKRELPDFSCCLS